LFSPQLPLPLEAGSSRDLEEFVVGPNEACVLAVQSVIDEPGASLFLHGAAGSGKSHLLNAACLVARKAGLTAFYCNPSRLPADGAATLEGLETVDLVCIDDLHRVAGQGTWEEALFHLINRLRIRGRNWDRDRESDPIQGHGRLLVASGVRLSALPLALPDLRSRLAWGLRLELQPLGESDKRQVMRERAAALGVVLPDEVIDYLLRHGRRGVAELVRAVEGLHLAAIQEKRPITVPLARRVLAVTSAAGSEAAD
jgi:DnaA family protein